MVEDVSEISADPFTQIEQKIEEYQRTLEPECLDNLEQELFPLIPDLESIPGKIRKDIIMNMEIRHCKAGGRIIKPEEDITELYILLKGIMQFAPLESRMKILDAVKLWRKLKKEGKNNFGSDDLLLPGGVFGQLKDITKLKFGKGTIFALERSSYIALNYDKAIKLIKDCSDKAEFQEVIGFLCTVLPGYSWMSSSNQRKVADCFKPYCFNIGQFLVNEGENGGVAYIIKEGQCRIQSSKNPLEVLPDSIFNKKKHIDTLLRPLRGYLSNSTNIFQYGILEKLEWVAPENLINETEIPLKYSVLALKRVEAYGINKKDAMKKLPPKICQYLLKITKERNGYLSQRAQSLVTTTRNIAQMDPSGERYDERYSDVRRHYPYATGRIIKSIRKIQLLNKIREETKSEEITLPKLNTQRSASPEGDAYGLNQNSPQISSRGEPQSAINRYKLCVAESTSRFLHKHTLVPTIPKRSYENPFNSLTKLGLSTILGVHSKNNTTPMILLPSKTRNSMPIMKKFRTIIPNAYQ